MRAIVKPWNEIRKTLGLKVDGCWEHHETPRFFDEEMKLFCGKIIDINPPDNIGNYRHYYHLGEWYSDWNWHPSWIDIIDEDEWDAEIYALLLIESGVIYE